MGKVHFEVFVYESSFLDAMIDRMKNLMNTYRDKENITKELLDFGITETEIERQKPIFNEAFTGDLALENRIKKNKNGSVNVFTNEITGDWYNGGEKYYEFIIENNETK